MFDARQGSAILQVVAMVIVLGILGNGLSERDARRAGARGERAPPLQGDADHACPASVLRR